MDACKIVILGLVLTYLDNCNGLSYKIPDTYIKKLQRVLNDAAKLLLQKRTYDSATSCLKYLHWLPVKLRVQFKIVLTVNKCLLVNVPNYVIIKLKVKMSGRRFRSTTGTHTAEVFFTITRHLLTDPSMFLDLNYRMNYRPIIEISRSANLSAIPSSGCTLLFLIVIIPLVTTTVSPLRIHYYIENNYSLYP